MNVSVDGPSDIGDVVGEGERDDLIASEGIGNKGRVNDLFKSSPCSHEHHCRGNELAGLERKNVDPDDLPCPGWIPISMIPAH